MRHKEELDTRRFSVEAEVEDFESMRGGLCETKRTVEEEHDYTGKHGDQSNSKTVLHSPMRSLHMINRMFVHSHLPCRSCQSADCSRRHRDIVEQDHQE